MGVKGKDNKPNSIEQSIANSSRHKSRLDKIYEKYTQMSKVYGLADPHELMKRNIRYYSNLALIDMPTGSKDITDKGELLDKILDALESEYMYFEVFGFTFITLLSYLCNTNGERDAILNWLKNSLPSEVIIESTKKAQLEYDMIKALVEAKNVKENHIAEIPRLALIDSLEIHPDDRLAIQVMVMMQKAGANIINYIHSPLLLEDYLSSENSLLFSQLNTLVKDRVHDDSIVIENENDDYISDIVAILKLYNESLSSKVSLIDRIISLVVLNLHNSITDDKIKQAANKIAQEYVGLPSFFTHNELLNYYSASSLCNMYKVIYYILLANKEDGQGISIDRLVDKDYILSGLVKIKLGSPNTFSKARMINRQDAHNFNLTETIILRALGEVLCQS